MLMSSWVSKHLVISILGLPYPKDHSFESWKKHALIDRVTVRNNFPGASCGCHGFQLAELQGQFLENISLLI